MSDDAAAVTEPEVGTKMEPHPAAVERKIAYTVREVPRSLNVVWGCNVDRHECAVLSVTATAGPSDPGQVPSRIVELRRHSGELRHAPVADLAAAAKRLAAAQTMEDVAEVFHAIAIAGVAG